jgi:N-ethylmaleimide reductase
MNGLGFGFHGLGEAMTLGEFRAVFRGSIIGNCGYTIADAEKDVANGDADMIAIGRPYISNPDLVDRIRNEWPLATMAEMSTWYSPTGATGYTDFPSYTPA